MYCREAGGIRCAPAKALRGIAFGNSKSYGISASETAALVVLS